ncbi:MAG: type II toxin-antitoxin system RelE/ParE family toxin [Pyrinomonadaceae bacterium]
MQEIRVAAAAEDDLRRIWEYVGQNNPEAASKLIKEITRKFTVLRSNGTENSLKDARTCKRRYCS